MVGTPVHINRRPYSAFLTAWGRASDGWWGCCRFTITLTTSAELPVAAWLPAAAISRPGWASTIIATPRITLPTYLGAWPPPDGWPSWYAGAWPTGDLPLPPGLEMATEPAWRRKRG